MPEQTYTITLPGVQDVFVVPPLESNQLKLERIARMRSTNSPIPEPLRWIPQVINWLDDAQDTLITALILGLPLLRRLPSKFIPYLGWALLANDALNLFNMFLSAPLAPRIRKAEFIHTTQRALGGRLARIRAAETFILPGRVKFLPFLLTAGQVLYSYTGWGLRLGTIMGTISDSFWGIIRLLQGNHLRIIGPPPSDPFHKAARFLSQSYIHGMVTDAILEQDKKLIALATNAAWSILGAPNAPFPDDARLEEMGNLPVPRFEPWTQSSRQALEESNIVTGEEMLLPLPGLPGRITYGGAVQASLATDPAVDIPYAAAARNPTYDFPYGQIATEGAEEAWAAFSGVRDNVYALTTPMERMMSIALEQNIIPPFLAYPAHPEWPARIVYQSFGVPVSNPLSGPTIAAQDPLLPTDEVLWARTPAAYPPPSLEPNVQLAHWCAIALGLYCGRAVMLPIFSGAEDLTQQVVTGWITNDQYWGFRAPERASALVWGNIWKRCHGYPEPPPGGSKVYQQTCLPRSNGWVSLPGSYHDHDQLNEITDRLTRPGDVPADHEYRVPVFTETLGRDWLDAYLIEFDPRRLSGPPPFPPRTPI